MGTILVDDFADIKTIIEYLANKPKVFLVNFCRRTGSLITRKEAEGSDVEGSQVVSNRTLEQHRTMHMLNSRDCLGVFLTYEGEGTVFIQALVNGILQGSQTADVLSIITSVIGQVVELQIEGDYQKEFQPPVLYSSLTKELYILVLIT